MEFYKYQKKFKKKKGKRILLLLLLLEEQLRNEPKSIFKNVKKCIFWILVKRFMNIKYFIIYLDKVCFSLK